MTEIRPIHRSEAETFLKLVCDVFDLDFDRALGLFFNEPYFDLARKWALFEGGEMVACLTTTPLLFGWGSAIGIAGVATAPDRRREGHAGRLIEKVLKSAESDGEGPALLLAKDMALYERLGFEPIDRVIRGSVDTTPDIFPKPFEFDQVRSTYDAWADGHPDRLRRDERRWRYWNWSFRSAIAYGDGYACTDLDPVREVLSSTPHETLPFNHPVEWLGTTFMTDQLGLKIDRIYVELYLMGRNIPGIPQLFMTDQF